MIPDVQKRAKLLGVIATEPARWQGERFGEDFLLRGAQEKWRVEAIANRGFVAFRCEEADAPADAWRSPSGSPMCSLFKDEKGFTAAQGTIYPVTNELARHLHQAYQQYGPGLAAKLDGQFWAVGYDCARELFWITVDSFGISRIFYRQENGLICFSDDVVALLSWSKHPVQPCCHSIHAYFSLYHVPAPYTGFAGIDQLAPNSVMLIGERRIAIKKGLWSPAQDKLDLTEAEAIQNLSDVLHETLSRIMRKSDRVALLFSGGIDSSVVGALLTRGGFSAEISAHTLGAEGSDELRLAAERARWLGLPFHGWSFPAEPSPAPETIISRWPMPVFAFPAFYTDWFCREVAHSWPHLICASGADGIFLGEGLLLNLIRENQTNGTVSPGREAFRIRTLFRPSSRFARRFLYPPEFRQALGSKSPDAHLVQLYRDSGVRDIADGLILQVLALAHHSIAAIPANAVEESGVVHFPFLQKNMIEFVFSLPLSLRLDTLSGRQESKPLLKKLLRRFLPAFPVDERKRGFGHSIAIERWLTPVFANQLESRVLDSGLCQDGILRSDAVVTVFDACTRAGRDSSLLHLAWGIFALSVWYRCFVKSTVGS